VGDYLRRVEALEELIDPPPSANTVHIIVCEAGETSAEARARYLKVHEVHPAARILVISTRPLSSTGDDVH
jgi:hypothetical protein